MILAVTGPLDASPTDADLDALWRCCARRGVRVVRMGDAASGVAPRVQAALERIRLSRRAPTWDPPGRQWVWERWSAMPPRGAATSKARIEAMLEGDGMRCGGVFCMGGIVSRGRVEELVTWPGGRETAHAREHALSLGIRVVPISTVVEHYAG